MCGIAGYYWNGKKEIKEVVRFLINALKTLEYRGYDSCGIGLSNGNKNFVFKVVGRVEKLEKKLEKELKKFENKFENKKNKSEFRKNESWIGIAHTRWATHGNVNMINTHPHTDCSKKIIVVHNGIIENYEELKKYLKKRGHKFKSQTDTEVIAHLFEEMLKYYDERKAWIATIKILEGSYAIVLIFNKKIFLARKSSPLIIGLNKRKEFFIASDIIAISKFADKFISLNDKELAILGKKIEIFNVNGKNINGKFIKIKQEEEEISKKGFETFMLKEIFEQKETIKNAFRGRIDFKKAIPVFGGFSFNEIRNLERIIIFACGSSYNAALYSKYLFDKFFDCHVELASELKYSSKKIDENDLLVAISQSGETIDVLEALKQFKNKALRALGIVNVVSSSISREVDGGIYLHAGREIGVAATKTYTSQLVVLFLLWVYLARKFGYMNKKQAREYFKEIIYLPKKIEKIFEIKDYIKKLAKKYLNFNNALVLGRKFNYATALEGALKLKEIAYVHAEALSAGEMKHGPIALIDDKFYSIFIVPHDSVIDKVINNMQEIKARKGKIIAITTKGKNIKKIEQIADDVIFIPNTKEELLPILCIIPLQLFSYYTARLKGIDVDKPRNLAKTVTVE